MTPFPALAEAVALVALDGVTAGEPPADPFARLWDWLAGADEDAPARRLADGFDLGDPERALVAVLLAVETSEAVARAAAAVLGATGSVSGGGLPLWLACRAVPGLDPGVLAATRPLSRFGFVHADRDGPRVETRLRLAAAVVDRLLGYEAADPLVVSRAARLPVRRADPATPGLAARLEPALAARGPLGLPPLVLAPGARTDELGAALRALGLEPWRLPVALLPDDPAERDRLAAVWSREAALDAAALILEDTGAPVSPDAVAGFADRVLGHVLHVGSAGVSPTPDGMARGVHALPVDEDPAADRRRWAVALGPARTRAVGAGLDRVADRFRLEPVDLDVAVAAAGPGIDAADGEPAAAQRLWHAAARAVAPAPIPGVRIAEPAHGWDDIVLAGATADTLRRIEAHIRHATRVFDEWGFAGRRGGGRRGRGVAVLFAGPSGTGKTMAADVLADALDLRVMSIDTSLVISKYVGETSRNIATCFEQAERSGAVMVWNEGDAVWGARGGVGNAVDRHVNAEVGDLLQRIEEFSGFTVVTTNLRHAIDAAFLRRFRFVLDFPPPSQDERRRLWASAFPPAAPVEVTDWGALAGLPLTGGSIRTVALGAAFRAAEAGTPVTREILAEELADELRKLNLPAPRLVWSDDGIVR